MEDSTSGPNRRAVGLRELLRQAGDVVPTPLVSYYAAGTLRQERHFDGYSEITIPARSAPTSLLGHLKFAIKNEALDLRVWHVIAAKLGPDPFLTWIKSEPTGRHSRRAWYLYEGLTNSLLPVDDASVTNYVPLADHELQLTARARKSSRHRVADNLLGTFEFCPLVRNSAKIRSAGGSDLKLRAQRAIDGIDPKDLRRATDYLYHKESKASFQIEKEEISMSRMERFVSALRSVAYTRWYNESELVALQNAIVDPRYVEASYRTIQNYVGQTLTWGKERVHYPCPPPQEVRALMEGWRATLFRTVTMEDAVCQAAILGFGFVFIHPFEDGNGRIHRFLIHATLVRRHFTPDGVVIPVSATMLRRMDRYDATLEAFSKPLLRVIEYSLDTEGRMTIDHFPAPIYKFWDATPQCEYLYDALAEAVDVDLPEELRTLRTYDAARRAVLSVVDMPDRKLDLLTHLLLQNNFRLARRKREAFAEISDPELSSIEMAVREACEIGSFEPGLGPHQPSLADDLLG
jgi:hypothetical protein